MAAATAVAVAVGLMPTAGLVAAPASAAPVGAGFELNAADLRFILKQIKIAEQHAATATPGNPCGTLLGDGPHQIPDSGNNAEELPWGLRTVDGSCNNLMPDQEDFGAADQVFPRRSQAQWRGAETNPFTGQPTSYGQTSGDVFDSQPRVISNLIVDQTNHNPAAVAAAGADPSAPKTDESLSIPNVAPDVGLSAPFNSVFIFFGQFFDHGLDLVTKTGDKVYMPLQADDPLYVEGSPTNFMVLSRSVDGPGPDGVAGTADDREAANQTTPFVDQNQTYASHASHQVFLREYALDAAGAPMSTGRLLEGADGGMSTWADVKAQARDLLGIALGDLDVLEVPLLATDQYGEFQRGPNGYPQLVLADGTLREGDPAAPVSTQGAVKTGHAFLVDIAHHAVPVGDKDPTNGPGPIEPLDPDTDPGTSDDRDRTTYDDEMLAAHFMAGDGRVNENIALTAVHHIFHSEHNRLTGHIQDVLLSEDPAMVPEWQLADGTWDGERIFQAAKFVTEMEYQHLAFEEFARKVQPMVNEFGEGGTGYDTSLNPAIKAEFAHAAYRFGHSMLTETVARRNAGGGDNSLPLLGAFLNPPEFTDGGAAGALTPEQAAGSLFRGLSRQVGAEIDEFVTPALRSNLLGLPLDLAAINLARARETGVPSLNAARRQFYAETGNSALAPYTSWADFGFGLTHRESLVNFVAAYGTHPSLAGLDETVGTADDTATTVADKRAAAARLVANDPGADPLTPPDAADFLNGTGTWAGKQTGIDDVDLWAGGLAEKKVVFGGLLGSTLNYIFELQMEELQFGDRFYYLSRTAGLNLLTALEGNSFAEMIQRNTDVQGLPADVFSRPDYVFNVANLGTSGPIADDLSTEDYDESDTSTEPGMHLTRRPDGTVRYFGPAHVVFNGTAGADRIWSSEGDDTIRGNDGDDWIQGGDGNDSIIGGLGDDILTDLAGDDTIKGGPGHDAISSGQGFGGDLNQGGPGKDFIVGGNDDTETFAGPGDDFVFAGDGSDTVFGDDGDDWIEGGKGPFNLLQGDSGNPFQNDPNGGHDVLSGHGGEQDFDSEGGDDIMLLGPGIQRAEGMLGFDWATHKNDPQPGDSDMLFTELTRPAVDTLRDRFDQTEALSGWKFDDILRGDSRLRGEAVAPADPAEPEGTETEAEAGDNPEEHVLTAAGIDRINGLAGLLPAGTTSFNSGNILLGGGGDDTLEGRGGDDIIDGDKWLNVQLQAPDPATGGTQRVDSMAALRADVFAGRINPGDISIVRSIRRAPAQSSDDDRAVFSDLRANYDCRIDDGELLVGGCPLQPPAGAKVTVIHAAGALTDGTDTLTNVEHLVFSDSQLPGAPTNVVASGGNTSATVTFNAPADGAVTGFEVLTLDTNGDPVGDPVTAGAEELTVTVTGLTNGQSYRFQVHAVNNAGPGPLSAPSEPVTPAPTEPAQPLITAAVAGNQQVMLNWDAPDDGGAEITEYRVKVLNAAGNRVGALRTMTAPASRLTVTGLINGRTYWFQVAAVNEHGPSEASDEVNARPGTRPGVPQIGTAAARNGSAVVRWQAPTDDGGLAVTAYRIRVVDEAGNQVGRLRGANAAATLRRVWALTNGDTYRVQVAALNPMGRGRFSRLSNPVTPGPRPDAPRMRRPVRGAAGGKVTATARWRPVGGVLPITGYRVVAVKVASREQNADVLRRFRSPVVGPRRQQFRFVVPRGLYRFQAVAWNSRGRSPWSAPSRAVRAR